MNDQQRVQALSQAGFGQRTIAAILGVEVAEVSQLRRGGEGDVPGDSRSYHLGIEIIDAGTDSVLLSRASLYVPECSILEVSCYFLWAPVGAQLTESTAFYLTLDDEMFGEFGSPPEVTEPGYQQVAATLEDLEDPEFNWSDVCTTQDGPRVLSLTNAASTRRGEHVSFAPTGRDSVVPVPIEEGTHTVELLVTPHPTVASAVADRRLSLSRR